MHTHNDKPEAGTATNVLGGRLHGIDEHVAKAEKPPPGKARGRRDYRALTAVPAG